MTDAETKKSAEETKAKITAAFSGLKVPTKLNRLLADAKRQVANMTPKQREEMFARQRESFVRAMTTPCEHGELDFEQCPQCRDAAQREGMKRILDKQAKHNRLRPASRRHP